MVAPTAVLASARHACQPYATIYSEISEQKPIERAKFAAESARKLVQSSGCITSRTIEAGIPDCQRPLTR